MDAGPGQQPSCEACLRHDAGGPGGLALLVGQGEALWLPSRQPPRYRPAQAGREATMKHIDPATLRGWILDGAELALIDAREDGEFGAEHLFWAVPFGMAHRETRAPANPSASASPTTGAASPPNSRRGWRARATPTSPSWPAAPRRGRTRAMS